MAGMMGGAIRVVARRSGHRRAGIKFGDTPTTVPAEQLTSVQLVAILDDPMLETTVSADGETFLSMSVEHRQGVRAMLAASTDARESVLDRLADGTLGVDAGVRAAMLGSGDAWLLAQTATEARPAGTGAGADHPASETDLVEQPAFDPNPALPVAGAVSDNATPAKVVETKPVGPEPAVAAAVDAVVAPEKVAAGVSLARPAKPKAAPKRA